MLLRQFSSSEILILGQNPSFWQQCGSSTILFMIRWLNNYVWNIIWQNLMLSPWCSQLNWHLSFLLEILPALNPSWWTWAAVLWLAAIFPAIAPPKLKGYLNTGRVWHKSLRIINSYTYLCSCNYCNCSSSPFESLSGQCLPYAATTTSDLKISREEHEVG